MQHPGARSTSGRDRHVEVRRLTDRDLLAALLRREPVNPVDDAEDPSVFDRALSDRTDVDRRVYGLVDPTAPDHPATVVWVALTRGVPRSLDALTDDREPLRPSESDTAAFWSIWNVADETAERAGGARPPGGRDLIEGAVQLLLDELPSLRTFVTLSPIPGLRRWIASLPDSDRALHPSDHHRQEVHEAPDLALEQLAARYLTTLGDDGRPLDAVARFHLGNGARLWRVNSAADRSARGAERSHGMMANYRYLPEDRRENLRMLGNGTVAVSDDVAALVRMARG